MTASGRAGAIPRPFFSVDVARRADGTDHIVEIGDGQVSDLVGWSVERFFDIRATSASCIPLNHILSWQRE